jgi:D-alanine-D-alanine ligase
MNSNIETRSKLRILVVSGGVSPEAEVSRASGNAVEAALRNGFSDVTHWGFDWDLRRKLLLSRPDVAFPVLHGGLGEDGSFQGFLEVLGIPYVGSGVAACAVAMDKHIAKTVFRAEGIPVAADIVCHRHHDPAAIAERAMEAYGGACVVKPTSQGSALGLSFCATHEQIVAGITHALAMSSRALIEPRIIGREITVAVLADPEPCALPPVEIVLPAGATFDYYHRYTPGACQHLCPAPLPAETLARVEQIGVAAHRALGCRHYSRTDLLVQDDGDIVVLELNTLPGMTATSLYPDAARAAGISFEELVRRLVELALAERRADSPCADAFQPSAVGRKRKPERKRPRR